MVIVFFDQVENRVVDHIPIAFATKRPWHVTIKVDLSAFFRDSPAGGSSTDDEGYRPEPMEISNKLCTLWT